MAIAVVSMILSFFAALLSTPLVGCLSLRLGIIDYPNHRRIHTTPTPKGGGLAILLGFSAALLYAAARMPNERLGLPGLLICTLLVGFVGLVDDKYELSPMRKLAGLSIPAAVWALLSSHGSGVYGTCQFIFVVFLINAVNLFDGMDGLASGVCAISALVLAVLGWTRGDLFLMIPSAALAGGLLGFLPRNSAPASIFMGDAGSLPVGFVLAAMVLRASLQPIPLSTSLPALLAVGLPLFDTTVSMVRRYINARPLFGADKSHTYNVLAHRIGTITTVRIAYLAAVLLGACALLYELCPVLVVRAAIIVLIIAGALVATKREQFLQVDAADSERDAHGPMG